jgi:hypothetical protein
LFHGRSIVKPGESARISLDGAVTKLLVPSGAKALFFAGLFVATKAATYKAQLRTSGAETAGQSVAEHDGKTRWRESE